MRLELERLADEGLDWRHERSQCILAYFKISVSYNLNYDTEFCTVRNPGNILALVQKVQGYLSEEEENANLAAATLEDIPVQTVDEDLPVVVEQLPVIIEDEKDQEAEEPFKEAVIVDKESGDAVPVVLVDEELVEQVLDEAENTPDVSEPIVIVDDADIVEDDNSTSVSDAKQLTEASMAKKEPKG